MMADTCNPFAYLRSFIKDGPAGEKDFLGDFLALPLAGPCSGRKSPSGWGALRGRGTSKGQIARYRGRTAAATRLSPVDWEMDSNQGFIPASGAWRGRDVVGRKWFKSQNPVPGVFSLCDSGLSARTAKFGRGGRGLVESIFPLGRPDFQQ
jgi:hypothetical protein